MLAEEGRAPQRERSWPEALPAAPERARARRARPAGQQDPSPRPGPSPNPRAIPGRLLAGRWAAALAAEPTAVLVHSGIGQQLLSMRLGEGGAGLSLGARLPVGHNVHLQNLG